MIVLRNATRHYETPAGVVRALDGIDLEIDAGEFTVLAGPSGSGKSTLLHLVGALDLPTSGSVAVNGIELETQSPAQLADLRRDNIGFVFQAYNLVPVLSAAENIEYVMMLQGVDAAERRRKTTAILDEVGLRGLGDRRPDALSGGQQQRVAVARAVVSEPSLVLADEPTANLDSRSSQALMDLLAQLNERHGTTFVFSTHDAALIERARRIIHLNDGRVESDEQR